MWLWLSVAFAGEMPKDVDLDDLDKWDNPHHQALKGPSGCWVFEGQARSILTGYSAGGMFGAVSSSKQEVAGPFTGTLNNGVWTSFDFRPTTQDTELPIFPVVGKMSGDAQHFTKGDDSSDEMSVGISADGNVSISSQGSRAINIAQMAVDELGTGVSTTAPDWDPEKHGVTVYHDVPMMKIKGNKAVAVQAFFPNGANVVSELDAVWPKTIRVGVLDLMDEDDADDVGFLGKMIAPDIVVKNFAYHLQSHVYEGQPLPVSETIGGVFGMVGFTVGIEQRVTYSNAKKCAQQ